MVCTTLFPSMINNPVIIESSKGEKTKKKNLQRAERDKVEGKGLKKPFKFMTYTVRILRRGMQNIIV